MARLQRQELKHDEFVDTMDELLLYAEQQGRTLLVFVLAVVVGGGSLGGFYWYSRKQEHRAEAALGAALMTLELPVQPGLPPLPGDGPRQSFPSEREKYEAAEKEFAAVRAAFPRTRAALFAKHHQALCLWEKGEREAAVAALGELSRAADPHVAALAGFSLAGFYESLGRAAEAEKLYRQLAEHPTTTVPRATALLALASLRAAADPAEARRLLVQVKAEFPDTSISGEVTRRLDLLPAPSTPAPSPKQP